MAFLVILLLIFPFVRSLRVGVLAGIANLLPLLLILGLMGWLGIPVDIASVMIASVALGIVVDDTIHFLYHFRRHRRTSGTGLRSIRRTYAVVGSPLVTTSIVFIGGFLILTPSTFQPTSNFGLLSAITIAAAFVADLLLLPALLIIFGSSEM
jgi:predicted RND superfamily exporter protein